MRNQAYHYSEVGVDMSADTGEHVWVSPVPKNAEHRYFKLYDDLQYPETVSYTHLTLPTICSV